MGQTKCIYSGDVVRSAEASRFVSCPCGARFETDPRLNRRVAGEVVEGWTAKIPSHVRLGEERK